MLGRPLKNILVAAALCMAALSAWAGAGGAADGTEPLTLPNDLPAIRWIVVERNGEKAVASNPREDCARFGLTQRAAARHLKVSRRISKWDHDHTIDWLPCLSKGRVGFTDGRSAYWAIAEGGGSSVRFEDGSEVHLYCANCKLPHTESWRHEYNTK
jgi:hypothetical protein